MTDHQQAAIEAANEVLASYGPVCNFPDSPTYLESVDKLNEGDAAETALAAAEPHLRKKWAEEVRAIDITQVGGVTDPVTRALKMAGKAEMKSAIITLLEGPGNE